MSLICADNIGVRALCSV